MNSYILSSQSTSDLVDHIYAKEQQKIRSHRYRSLKARNEDLRRSQASYDISKQLLKSEPPQVGHEKNELQVQLWEVSRGSIRFAHEALINLQLREQYIGASKIITTQLNRGLEGFGGTLIHKLDTLKDLQASAKTYCEEMKANFNVWRDATSPGWRLSSKVVPPWQQLLNREAFKMDRPFFRFLQENRRLENFSPQQQIRIYQNAYQSMATEEEFSLVLFRRLAAAISVLTVCAMVWYVLQDKHSLGAAAKASVSIPAALALGYLGTQAGSFIIGAFISGPIASILCSLFGGIIGSFVGGLAGDYLFDVVVDAFSPNIPDTLKTKMFGAPIHYELTLPNTVQLSRDFISKLS